MLALSRAAWTRFSFFGDLESPKPESPKKLKSVCVCNSQRLLGRGGVLALSRAAWTRFSFFGDLESPKPESPKKLKSVCVVRHSAP